MIETVLFKGQWVPKYITEGNHAKFIIPTAKQVCKGKGIDVGCGKLEWAFPGAIPVDPNLADEYHADNLPLGEEKADYIFSSHCLEHIPDYMETLRYWTSVLRPGGVLFLYLPHPEYLYWRPHFKKNDKHYHSFYPDQMREVLESLNYTNIFQSERDLAWSFAIFGEKM